MENQIVDGNINFEDLSTSVVMKIYRRYKSARELVLHRGDCMALLRSMPNECVDLTITSPPYCMGKEYEKTERLQNFVESHWEILPQILRVTKEGGSICWQVGYHVRDGSVMPLDFIIHDLMKRWPQMILRNRIIWTFGHGMHASNRFSGRHEIILWYTKGTDFKFNLDDVRVPQKYPGKRHYHGPHKGKFSCNPLGKNPGDIWDLPNVKARHIEKTNHPCQFPIALAQRLIRAFSNKDDTILDPFMGSGTTAAAAILESRRFVGAEIKTKYFRTTVKRCKQAVTRLLPIRPLEKPILIPDLNSEVAKNPFLKAESLYKQGNKNRFHGTSEHLLIS